MTEREIQDYIRNYNLVIDTIEQIVSFMKDREYCRISWYDKQEIVQYVYGEKYPEIWMEVCKEITRQRN